jgi:TRAP-type mannitol/chloroaromatic compound transport system permease large subunit
MMEFIAANLAPIMFMSLVVFLLMGYPVAFSLAANGLMFFVVGVYLSPHSNSISLAWPLLGTLPGRILDVLRNETLLAIPFFTFMGIILERSRMAEDLLDTVGQLFGPVRGGLAYAVILVGALLAATTGVVAASVIAMGLISLPIMLRYGYDRPLATGVIAASGTLAQIIPPSLVLIVLADQLGVSVGDMYSGAIYPGLILVAVYCLYILGVTLVRPDTAPALPLHARTLGGGAMQLLLTMLITIVIGFACYFVVGSYWPKNPGIWAATIATLLIYLTAVIDKATGINFFRNLTRQVIFVLIPPLSLIFLVLGTIFLGVATPTEGGAMGAAGALLLSFAKRRLNYSILSDALDATTKLACFVMFILIGSRVFSLTFYGIDGHRWVEHLFIGLPGGEWGFLIAVNVLVFFLGCFIDFFEIAFIVIPLLAPVAQKLGIDLVWFGIIIGINLQTSFLTPPFGFALFYMRSVAPVKAYLDKVTGQQIAGIKTTEIYWGAVSFIVLQLFVLGIALAFPGLSLPNKGPVVDTSKVQIELPGLDNGLGGDLVIPGAPDLSQPPEIK